MATQSDLIKSKNETSNVLEAPLASQNQIFKTFRLPRKSSGTIPILGDEALITRKLNDEVTETDVYLNGFHSSSLEENMESLDLDCSSIDTNVIDCEPITRKSQRTSSNRRYSLRPQRQIVKTSEYAVTPKKKTVRKNGFLETIFESPVNKRGRLEFLGSKGPRSISFSHFVSKAKIRQRKLKIKRLSKTKLKTKKPSNNNLTIDDVKFKLKCLEESCDEADWMDVSKSPSVI